MIAKSKRVGSKKTVPIAMTAVPAVTSQAVSSEHLKPVTAEDMARIKDLLCTEENGASPVKRAANTYMSFLHESERQSGTDVILDLAFECAKVERGDTSRLEHMLVSQAHALDGIFHRLVQRASGTMDLQVFEAFMRMGLRAQNQSRAAVEALNEMKCPRSVAFVQHANIAQNQQVNNAVPHSGAAALQIRPNELKEIRNEHALDTTVASKAGRSDQVTEALGAVHGPAKPRRKGTK